MAGGRPKILAENPFVDIMLKKFMVLAAAALQGVNAARAEDFTAMIDSILQEYNEAPLVHADATTGVDDAAVDESTRALLSMRKNMPLLEILSLQ